MKLNTKFVKMSNEQKLYTVLKNWVNHSKEAEGRIITYYPEFEHWWKMLKDLYKITMDTGTDKKKRTVSKWIHKGKIYRLHKTWNAKQHMAGVRESDNCQSWSKSPNFADNIYWIHDEIEYLLIEATIPENDYAIDLNGVCSTMDRKLGTPAIEKEQEVVYPIRYKDVDKISSVIFRKGSIVERANFYSR